MKAFLARHPKIASAIRHAVITAIASFSLTILPIVEELGAGRYDLATAKALVVAGAAGAVAAAIRAVVLDMSERLGN